MEVITQEEGKLWIALWNNMDKMTSKEVIEASRKITSTYKNEILERARALSTIKA